MLYFFCSEVGFTDAGNYTCIVTNKYGTANASGTLTVKGNENKKCINFSLIILKKFCYRTYKNHS